MPSKTGYYDPDRESQSNEHWLPWLQHELIIRDVLTQTPELPKPYDPTYEEWLDVFRRFQVDEDSVLVGHSLGGGFLVRWLSESDVRINKLILVAPWIDPDGKIKNGFFNFKIDGQLEEKVNELHILHSKDDDKGVRESVKTLRNTIKDHKYHEFEKHGHFCFGDMKTREFPELLKLILD